MSETLDPGLLASKSLCVYANEYENIQWSVINQKLHSHDSMKRL